MSGLHPRRRWAIGMRAVVRLGWVAVVAVVIAVGAGAAQADEPSLGFAVTDDQGAHLLSAWRDLGGAQTLGAPVSHRFALDGHVAQVFEHGVLRWGPGPGASLVNVLDLLAARGHDDVMLAAFGIPPSADWSADVGAGWPAVQRRHMALLDGSEPWREALREAFRTAGAPLANDNAAIALHGLPMAVAETEAGYALRAQRAAWVYAPETDAAPRRVAVLGLLQAARQVPPRATVPQGPDPERPARPVSVVHFFDWWSATYLPSEFFTHELSWERIGITRSQVGSPGYYDANFRLIRDLGVGGVMWEWYEGANLSPDGTVLDSLRRHDLKIGLFYDWELLHAGGQAVLSDRAYIAADEPSLSKIADEVIAFYRGDPAGPVAVRRGRPAPRGGVRLRLPGGARRHGGVDVVLHRACAAGRDSVGGRGDLRLVGRLPATVPGPGAGVRALAG